MARASSSYLLATFAFLIVSSNLIAAEDSSKGVDFHDLNSQIKSLGKQIQEAEAGKLQAQKLLEAGKENEQSFLEEIKLLKASISDKDKQESAIQKQISLLQEEADKLKKGAKLHQELEAKLREVSKELGATKDTLSKTLEQLADKTSKAASAQSQVADAERKLEAAKKEREEANEKLGELQSNAEDFVKLQKQLKQESSRADKLQGDVESVKEEVTKLRGQLQAVESDSASWKTKAEKATKAVERAERKLEKALQEHTATHSALLQAEAKAEEAIKQMENLLTAWLPHWLEQRYQQVTKAVQPAVKHVQPALETAWKHGKRYSRQGHAQALWALGVTRAKTVSAWKTAQPAVNKALTDSKKHLSTFSEHVGKVSAPHLKGLSAQSQKALEVARTHAREALSHPQVLKARRRAEQTMRELENLAIVYLEKVPQLAQYAKRPTVTYLVYAVLAAPLITILVPLLALRGEKKAPPQYETRKLSQRDGLPPEQPLKNKAKKARRISVGQEHVRVP